MRNRRNRVGQLLGTATVAAVTGASLTATPAHAAKKCSTSWLLLQDVCLEVQTVDGTAVKFVEVWTDISPLRFEIVGRDSQGRLGWQSRRYDAPRTGFYPICNGSLGGDQFSGRDWITPCHHWPSESTVVVAFWEPGADTVKYTPPLTISAK